MKKRVVKLLQEIGVPAHIRGYEYLKEAIILEITHPEEKYIRSVTKKLYPDIAQKLDTTSSRVERAIRHAIEVAYNRGNIVKLEEIFGYTVDPNKGKPTNSEFISMLVEHLKLEDNVEDKVDTSESPTRTCPYTELEESDSEGDGDLTEEAFEIRKLKAHIVELRVDNISNSIPRGHCPYAYYNIDSDRECDGACDTCRRYFLEIMRKKITKEVFSPAYLK